MCERKALAPASRAFIAEGFRGAMRSGSVRLFQVLKKDVLLNLALISNVGVPRYVHLDITARQ
jgi:hypothetical protein